MNLDDYVKKIETEQKNAVPNWAAFFYDIDSYNLSNEKRDLIKSYRKYINSYEKGEPGIFYVGPGRPKNKEYINVIQQIKSSDNQTMCVLIQIQYNDGWGYHLVEDYQQRITKYKKMGSQYFYELEIHDLFKYIPISTRDKYRINNPCFYDSDFEKIIYSKDGKVFISEPFYKMLSDITTDTVGRMIAETIIYEKQKK